MLILAASSGLIFAVILGAIGSVDHRTETVQQMAEIDKRLRLAILGQETFLLDFALTGSDRALVEFDAAAEEEFSAYIQLAQFAAGDREVAGASTNVRTRMTVWRETWAEPFLRSGISDPAGLEAALQAGDRFFLPVEDALTSLDQVIARRFDATSADLSGPVSSLMSILVPLSVGLFLVLAVGGAWLIQSISGPLQRLNRTAEAIVSGGEATFIAEQDDEIGGLAIALERLRVDAQERYRDARVEAETAATFNQLAELTSFANDEATLVEAATRVLERIAPSPRGEVSLLNNSTNKLVVSASWGDGGREVGSTADVDRIDRCPGIRRATAYVADDLSDDLTVRCPVHPALSGTVVCLPMPALGAFVGVIHLERSAANSFDPLTVQSAARTAEQVALAIANARLMKTMEGLAMTDPLTGLHNARFFDAYLENQYVLAEREQEPIGLIMLDVDNFKKFNDNYGHPAGDEALRTVSRAMRSTIRAADVVARYGGEEFIVALHRAKLDDVKVIAEKLRVAVEQAVVEIGPGRYGRLTISLGVVSTDVHHVDQKRLVSLADAALYRAKAGGRNRVEIAPVGTDELSAAILRRGPTTVAGPVVLAIKPRTSGSPRRIRVAKSRAAEG
ncbi:MAG: sensor domain-containing diguanylate cyclase [Chloroflexota bacterium]|nr:sensor domain-containing diguanylate cyclase [Chloroflexota bacterium]